MEKEGAEIISDARVFDNLKSFCVRCCGEGVLLELSKRQRHERSERKRSQRAEQYKKDRKDKDTTQQTQYTQHKHDKRPHETHSEEDTKTQESYAESHKDDTRDSRTHNDEPHLGHEVGEKQTTCALCSGTGLVFGSRPPASDGKGHVTIIGGGIG